MKFWQVDSFTSVPFCGNPAAVFVTEQPLPDRLMADIAAEMNLAETAFVTLQPELRIRWFTPTVEVDLCGHATLAAAHVLWEENFVATDVASFASRSGPLGISRNGDGYTLDFPSQPPVERRDYIEGLQSLLGCDVLYAGSNGEDCVAVVDDPAFVSSWHADPAGIAGLVERGLLLTAKSADPDYDYIYRAFFPKLGIEEDPVTGSANTSLALFWAGRLGKLRLEARQVSKRGGTLRLELAGNRVLITGQAKTVFEGVMIDDVSRS